MHNDASLTRLATTIATDYTNLSTIESLRIEQAKRLQEEVGSSCLIVEGLVAMLALLFLAGGHPYLALLWLASTSFMVAVVYGYAKLVFPRPVDTGNYRQFLTGHIWISGATGVLWSAFAIFQLDPESMLSLTVASTICISITLGGMFPSSAYRPTYIALLSGCVLPLAAYWIVFLPNPYRFFAVGLGVYYVFGLITSARTEINMRELVLAEQAKALSEALQRRNETIEAANSEKSQFMLATVHDFSQPLHAQGYFIAALREQLDSPAQHDLLRRIEASWRSQEQLVRGVSDMAMLEGSHIAPDFMAVELEQLIDEVAGEFRGEPQIDFSVDLASARVSSDPALLKRVLRNLLSNAFKYAGQEASVSIASRIEEGVAVIRIQDTGPGIPLEDQQRIFERYVQLENTLDGTERKPGLGLGLSIVKLLTQLLDIDMGCESAPGAGTTFTLRLPLAPRAEQDAPKPLNADYSITVVVIDDDEDIRDGMRALLESRGCQALAFAECNPALEWLHDAAQIPDLLIVDYRLSGEERGDRVIEKLRDEINEPVPAVLMSGGVRDLQKLPALDDITIVSKPVDPANLQAIVSELALRSK